MKIVYLLRNPGIASRTPKGWESAVIATGANGDYSDEDLREVADADFVVVGLEPVPESIFKAAKRLKLVQRLGVGYDNIELKAAARDGVPVCNMPDFNAGTVAEHTIMLILALLRRVFEATLLMKAGHWPLPAVVAQGIYDLQGKAVGIIGIGNIGREVARRLRSFDVKTCYYDRHRLSGAEEEMLGVEFDALQQLLSRSDIVTCHLPLTSETHHLIGQQELQRMKRSAILINTARGGVVDEKALAEALQEGTIAAAGLDVFSEEPPHTRHPLRRCPNVLLTPHIAGQTREAMERMVALMLENVQRVARNEEPLYRVTPP